MSELPPFVPATFTTADAAPNGCKRDTPQTERETCLLPLYRCRCSKLVKTCSRMTSWIVRRLCGECRCNNNNRRYSNLHPEIYGGQVLNKLCDAVGRPLFQVCMVVDHTIQNIRRNRSRKYRQLPNTNQVCNAYRA